MLIKQTKEMTERERIAVQNANNQYLQSLSYFAIGTILPFAGASAPGGFMICDGSSLDTTEYADLFKVIGYTYGGSGDDFNIPDLRGRTVVGVNESDEDFSVLNISKGEKEVKLTVEQMPKHRHTGIFWCGNIEEGNISLNSGENKGYNLAWNAGVLEAWPPIETGDKGGDQPHNNMPPYITLNYIIKVSNSISIDDFRLPIDQTYNPESENSQSGVALAPILQKKFELWQPNTEYKIGDVVVSNIISDTNDSELYVTVLLICINNHTSPETDNPKDADNFYDNWNCVYVNSYRSDVANYAINDGVGNNIETTYATKEEMEQAIGSALEGEY